jgi:hypothetical protein
MFHSRKTSSMLVVTTTVLMLVLAGFAAAGCGKGGVAGDGAFEHPSKKADVVLRLSTGGGFVPVSYALTQIPEFTLYGDGTVIVTGPVIAIYPGPALPNLQTTTVSEETIQAILSAAQEAGLFDPTFDYGRPGITDMGTTTITVNVDGKTYQSSIYALGAGAPGGDLTMEQQQARAAVSQLAGQLMDLTTFQKDLEWTPYGYTALSVYSSPAGDHGDAGVQPNTLAWPLSDLATAGEAVQPDGFRKLVVSGADLAALKPVLREATQITIWTYGDRDYSLSFRPLLPDETTES